MVQFKKKSVLTFVQQLKELIFSLSFSCFLLLQLSNSLDYHFFFQSSKQKNFIFPLFFLFLNLDIISTSKKKWM